MARMARKEARWVCTSNSCKVSERGPVWAWLWLNVPFMDCVQVRMPCMEDRTHLRAHRLQACCTAGGQQALGHKGAASGSYQLGPGQPQPAGLDQQHVSSTGWSADSRAKLRGGWAGAGAVRAGSIRVGTKQLSSYGLCTYQCSVFSFFSNSFAHFHGCRCHVPCSRTC